MLAKLNIMDYSLLLGIESQLKVGNEEFEANVQEVEEFTFLRSNTKRNDREQRFLRHKFQSPDEISIYHISIIDYLQAWNANKKME